jgi:hypothetical protein
MRFGVLAAVNKKIAALLGMTPYNLIDRYQSLWESAAITFTVEK